MGLFSKKEIAVVEKKELQVMDDTMVSKLVLKGDLSAMGPEEKVRYYNLFCNNLGLNPATQPFELITFQGKQRLYAKKDATEQLRKINKVSIYDMKTETTGDIYKVIVYGMDKDGRKDMGTGVVKISGLTGDNLANAIMKAETKAKRRFTLSICGLGILDELELEALPPYTTQNVTPKPQELPKAKTIKQKDEQQSIEEPPTKSGLVLQETPKDNAQPPVDTAESIFTEIMGIVNGNTLEPDQKIEVMKAARPAKGNLEELKLILKNIKGEFDV